jgi:hypothetical protein
MFDLRRDQLTKPPAQAPPGACRPGRH